MMKKPLGWHHLFCVILSLVLLTGMLVVMPIYASASPPAPEYIGYAEVLAVHDGWLYYSYLENNEHYSQYGDGLYRMRADGTGVTKLLEKQEVGKYFQWLNLTFYKDWIYYRNANDLSKLYRMRYDGTGKSKLSDDNFSGALIVSDDWIYYSYDRVDDGRTYRIRTDGTSRETISESALWIVGVSDGWVYFNDDNGLQKMRTDGTGIIKLNKYMVFATVVDDWIYYQNEDNDEVEIDGEIYYRAGEENGKLYRMRTDGTNKMKLDDCHYNWDNTFISNGRIYHHFLDSNNNDVEKVESLNTDGTGKTQFKCSDLYYIFTIENGWIYYQSNSAGFYLDGIQYENQGKIFRIRTDGSEKQEIFFESSARLPEDTIIMRLNSTEALLNDKKISVDPTSSDVAPFTLNGKTMIPVRFVQQLGAEVKYDSNTKPVTVTYGNTKLTMEFGKSVMMKSIDGQPPETIRLPTAPALVEGKTCLPIREVAEGLGFRVSYDPNTFVIVVSTANLPEEELSSKINEGKEKLPAFVEGVRSITSKKTSFTVKAGENIQLIKSDITFDPANVGCNKLIYSSDNDSIATVTSNGKVSAKSKGTAKITISSHNGKKTAVTVTVL